MAVTTCMQCGKPIGVSEEFCADCIHAIYHHDDYLNILDTTTGEQTLKAFGEAVDACYENHINVPIDKILITQELADTVFNTSFGPIKKFRGIPLEAKEIK